MALIDLLRLHGGGRPSRVVRTEALPRKDPILRSSEKEKFGFDHKSCCVWSCE
jgi:hypothetical protein